MTALGFAGLFSGAMSLSLDVGQIALRIGMAAALGGVVSTLYLHSRDPDDRTPGFPQALILLSPLITMVTLAVGENVAAAFTLVGTLAIVRFRTAVRDTRDTVYVIFSVAVGMSMGRFALDVAAAGVLIIGTVIAIMRALEKRRTLPIAPPPPVLARLRIIVTTLDPDPAIYSSILDRFECTATVVKSAADRDGKGLDLTLEVQDLAAEHYADLTAALLEVPEIAKATCNRLND